MWNNIADKPGMEVQSNEIPLRLGHCQEMEAV